METFTVLVGSIECGSSGQQQDNTRPVEFEAEELATRHAYDVNEKGGLTDTRGVTQTLYKAADDRFVVHIEEWSKWQGEPTHYSLEQIDAAALGPNGQYEMLGREAGFGRPLTLDEALTDR